MASLHEQVAACEHERIGVAHACLEQPLGVERIISMARYARVERCDVVGVDMWSSRESVYEFTVIGLVLLVPVFLKHELVESFVPVELRRCAVGWQLLHRSLVFWMPIALEHPTLNSSISAKR